VHLVSFIFAVVAAGVFALLIAVSTVKYIQSMVGSKDLKAMLVFGGIGAAGFVFLTVVLLTYLGVIAPWSGR